MKILCLTLLLMLPFYSHANEPWVLKYQSWSNWGAEGVVWMNSNGMLVISDGTNNKNIPCQSNAMAVEASKIDFLIQKLIMAKPENSNNEESKNCFDESRIAIDINLAPKVSKEHGEYQLFLTEQFSTSYGCNENKVDLNWINLIKELQLLNQRMLKSCVNSPFK